MLLAYARFEFLGGSAANVPTRHSRNMAPTNRAQMKLRHLNWVWSPVACSEIVATWQFTGHQWQRRSVATRRCLL